MNRLLLAIPGLALTLPAWSQAPTPSLDGTSIYTVAPAGGSAPDIIDPAGNIWQLSNTGCNMPAGAGPCAIKNGVAVGTNYHVAELLLCKGVIYHKNTTGSWYMLTAAVTGLVSWPIIANDPTPTCPLVVPPVVVPPTGASVTVNATISVTCPVTPAALLGAINSTMSCPVTITGLTMGSP